MAEFEPIILGSQSCYNDYPIDMLNLTLKVKKSIKRVEDQKQGKSDLGNFYGELWPVQGSWWASFTKNIRNDGTW